MMEMQYTNVSQNESHTLTKPKWLFSCKAGNVQGLQRKGMELDFGWMQADICNKRCERMATLKSTLHESVHRFRWTFAHEYARERVCLTEKYCRIISEQVQKMQQ